MMNRQIGSFSAELITRDIRAGRDVTSPQRSDPALHLSCLQRAARSGREAGIRAAAESLKSVHYVLETDRLSVAEIMVARGLTAGDAWEALIEQGASSPCHAGKFSWRIL